MKTFKEFVSLCEEVEDKSTALGFQATIRRPNKGGRISPDRKLTDAEKRRKSEKIGPDGERVPTNYRFRADATKQRGSQSQAPTQERGSADVKAKSDAAVKAERKAAAEKRAAAKSSGQDTPKAKPKSKDLKQQASKLLSKKSPEIDLRPADQPKRKVVGPKRADRTKIIRAGGRKLRDLLIAAKSKKLGIPPEQVKLDKSFDIK